VATFKADYCTERRKAELNVAEQSEEENIQKLLRQLTSQDWEDRKQGLGAITGEYLKDSHVLTAVNAIAERDAIRTVQNAARAVLGLPAIQATESIDRHMNAVPKKPLTGRDKAKEILFGSICAAVINGLIFGLALLMATLDHSNGAAYGLMLLLAVLVVLPFLNLAAIFISGSIRNRWFALGAALPLAAGGVFVIAVMAENQIQLNPPSTPFPTLAPSLISKQLSATLKGHTGQVWSVAWSPDGKLLASGSEDRTVVVWDVATGKSLATLNGRTDRVSSVAWSPDGQRLASASSDGSITIWNVATGKSLGTLSGEIPINSIGWSPDGKHLASGRANDSIVLWEVGTGKAPTTLTGHTTQVLSVAWSPDSQRLASGSIYGSVVVWDITTGKPLATLKGHTDGVWGLAWSLDGKRLASGSRDHTIIVWDVANGNPEATLKGERAAWNPDGKQLASSFDNTVIVWDVASGNPLTTLIGHTGGVTSIGWSPDGKQLATGSTDQTVIIWDVADVKP
jgi:Tol biopolymer transport system component